MIRPLVSGAGVSPRGYSTPLQRLVLAISIHHTLDESVEELLERHGLEIPRSAVDTILSDHADHAAELSELSPPVGALPSTGAREIVAEADGTFVRVVSSSPAADRRKTRKVEFKEMRLFAARAQGSSQASYAGGFMHAQQAGTPWARCALRAGWGANTHVHGCFDGALWIAQRFEEEFSCAGEYLVDFYHLCEYLAEASESFDQPEQWFAEQRERLKQSEVERVLEELRSASEPEQQPDDESPARRAIRYIENRRGHFFYKEAREKGLPIGSGMIESGHKHVLHKKLRIAGAWNEDKAHGIAQLRILRKNKQWDQYWNQVADRKAA